MWSRMSLLKNICGLSRTFSSLNSINGRLKWFCRVENHPHIVCFNNYHVTTKLMSKPIVTKDMTVSLIGTDNKKLGEMTYGDAEDLAEKENLKLEVDTHSKSDNAVIVCRLQEIKLTSDVHKVKSKSRTQILKSKIDEHDLKTKTDQVLKWLMVGHSVDLQIIDNGNDKKKVNKVCKHITDATKDLAIIKEMSKREKILSFHLKPKAKQTGATQNSDDGKLKPWKFKDLKMEKDKGKR